MKYAVKVAPELYIGMGTSLSNSALEDAALFDSPSEALSRTARLCAHMGAMDPAWAALRSNYAWSIVEVEEIAQPRYREGRTL